MAVVHVRGVPDEWHKAIRHECVETDESLSEFAMRAFRREMRARGKPLDDVEGSPGEDLPPFEKEAEQ